MIHLKFSSPENAARLFDLIRVEDERLPAAFYFALRDTLVANDLEQATRISYGQKRWRVVSLKGDVIETSGTMSGGGRTQFRGKMGTKVKTKTAALDTSIGGGQEDLSAIQIKAQDMQNQINNLQHMQGEKERLLGQLQQALRSKEPQLKKLRVEVNGKMQQIPSLEEQLEGQRKIMESTQSDQKRVAEMEALIAERQATFEKSSAKTKKFDDQIERIDKQLTELQNDLVNDVQKSITTLTTQITKLTKHVLKLRVAITTSERDVKKAEDNIAAMKEEIQAAQNELLKMAAEREQAEADAEEINTRLKEVAKEIEAAHSDSSGAKKEVLALQKQESDGKLLRLELEQKLQAIAKAIAEVKAQLPHWKNKLLPLTLNKIPDEETPETLKTYTEEELEAYKIHDLQYTITMQEEKMKGKTPNLNVIDEYQRKRDVYLERIQVLEDITNKRNDMRKLFDEIKKRRHNEFMRGFGIITNKLKEMYQMITQGGNAELELVDSMDPFSEGILFSVRPPRKSWKNISNLSGGEKTLSSLALVFALHYYKPSPLYFMDEIDAALDFKNVSIVANYIKDRTKNAQFIIISLRSNMFELADYLTGIYKVDDCTASLTIENKEPKIAASQPTSQVPALPLSQQNHQASAPASPRPNSGPLQPMAQPDFPNINSQLVHAVLSPTSQPDSGNASELSDNAGDKSPLNDVAMNGTGTDSDVDQ